MKSLNESELRSRQLKEILCGLFVLAVLASYCFVAFAESKFEMNWAVIWDFRRPLFSGWLITLAIAGVALIASTLLGIFFVLGRYTNNAFLSGFVLIIVELSRGTPLLVLIFVGYHILAPEDLDNKFVIGVGVLSIFSGAYLSEIFRGGIESIPHSQIEAARAVGFSKVQIARFVVIPQAMRRVLPSVAGQFANLIKDSSLLYVISVPEFTYEARHVMSTSYRNVEVVTVLALAYLILTLPMFWISRRLERNFAYTS